MRYVIIGNGAAGNAAAVTINNKDPEGEVHIFSDEPHAAYFRPLITSLIENGSGMDSLFRDGKNSPGSSAVRLKICVSAINPEKKLIELANGQIITYDKLLIATGSSAIKFRLPDKDTHGVYTLRTINDAEAIKEAAKNARRAFIIGGGRVGMKTALALQSLGLDVAVVEKLPRVVPLQFDDTASEIMKRAVESLGIRLFLGHTVDDISQKNGSIDGLLLDNGRYHEADLVVVAVGVRPNVELAGKAGIRVGRGVQIDKYLETSVTDIYAAGDVVETKDLITGESIVSGIWTNAVEMGRAAGDNMIGNKTEYTGAFGILNSLELAGVPSVSVGVVSPPADGGYQVYKFRRGNVYRKLVLKSGCLAGAILVGDIKGAGVYTGLIKRKADVAGHIDGLMTHGPSYASWLK